MEEDLKKLMIMQPKTIKLKIMVVAPLQVTLYTINNQKIMTRTFIQNSLRKHTEGKLLLAESQDS